MERKKSVWDYAAQVLTVYGFTMVVMNVFCVLVGEGAKPFSTLFSLGGAGLSVGTALQLLGMSVLIVFYKMVFFTDLLIKKMQIVTRTVLMLLAVIATIGFFVAFFGWFPAGDVKCWAMFLLCFGVSFVLSFGCTLLKERAENKQMEEALAKMRENE